MRLNPHAPTERDRSFVADLVASVHGSADSGAALLAGLPPSTIDFAVRPWQIGELASDWVSTPGAGDAGVLLYLHGRRFQHDEPPEVYAAPLVGATGLPVLLTHYRLSPQHTYPAALDDVLVAYQALLEHGRPAGSIVLVGHSAGATLALSALLRLRDAGAPLPAGAVVISPITDFTFSGRTMTTNADNDVITMAEAEQVRAAYLGDADPAGSPQSPLAAPAAGLPPLLIATGDAEMLHDDASRFANKADAAGVDVDYHVYGSMPHGFAILPLDAGTDLLRRIQEFVTQRVADH